MATRTVLEWKQVIDAKGFLDRPRLDPPFVLTDPNGRLRTKIWDISPNFHCSIIGTCITASELRQFFVKLRQPDAKTASDHHLHSRGVHAAGQHDMAGKLLHKMIDKRHETAVKRFTKALSAAEVLTLWHQALDQGDIPGAYWAVLTHPAADKPLIQEVFGEVHMLSHLIGSSSRLDLARLRNLERDLGAATGKVTRQEARLQIAASERGELLRTIERLESEIGQKTAQEQSKRQSGDSGAFPGLLQKLDAEKAHSTVLAARLAEAEDKARLASSLAATLTQQNDDLRRETMALESALEYHGPSADDAGPGEYLRGKTYLYVGGRPKLAEQLKGLMAQRGGSLLAHDGGIEDNIALLAGLISQADAVFFPVDCVSHLAAGKAKKLCRDTDKPFVPLRTASLASFMAAIVGGEPLRRHENGHSVRG